MTSRDSVTTSCDSVMTSRDSVTTSCDSVMASRDILMANLTPLKMFTSKTNKSPFFRNDESRNVKSHGSNAGELKSFSQHRLR